VGADVNTPLLNSLSTDSKGVATFVLPKEDVELSVAQVFRRLSGPVLKDVKLSTNQSAEMTTIIQDLLPEALNDFYDQDQQILLGRYTGKDNVQFTLEGNDGQRIRKMVFEMDLSKASAVYDFVPRIWATRKVATLVEALRAMGASGNKQLNRSDPKIKELVDEVVRISIRYGVLTEYTAFLAKDVKLVNTANADAFWSQTSANLKNRAIDQRVGIGSVNQEQNINLSKKSAVMNRSNSYLSKEMEVVEETRVQQIGRKTYVQRDGSWQDTTMTAELKVVDVSINTPVFTKLLDELIAENEQACLALAGEILVNVKGVNYRINR